MSLVKKFLVSVGGLAESTKTRYRQLIMDFIRQIGRKDVYDKDDVLKYLALLEKRGCSGNYRRFVFMTLRSFYDVMGYEWWRERKEERRIRPRISEPSRPYLRKEELEKVLEAVSKQPLMFQCIIRIACLFPIRRVEFHNLNREDYRRPYLRVDTAKHGQPKTLTLDKATCNLLDRYLKQRKDEDTALFVSAEGRISTTWLSILTRSFLEEAGVYKPNLGLHGFRRGVTTMLHHAGMSERELQELGGWRTLNMPHLYIQLEAGEADKKARSVHPLIKG